MSPQNPTSQTPASGPPASPVRLLVRRTTDIIAIGLLLAAALTTGRQVVDWWREEPDPPVRNQVTTIDAGRLLEPDQPLLLQFGELPVDMYQMVLRTDAESAWARLQARVRDTLLSSALLDSPSSPRSSGELAGGSPERAASELRVLELAAREDPVEELEPGSVYRFADQFAGAFAIQYGPGASRAERVLSGRLLAWGLLLPEGADGWRIYQFERRTAGVESRIAPVAGPPGGTRILTAGSGSTGTLAVFRGRGILSDWQEYYAGWFGRNGWSVDREWVRTEGRAGARYRQSTPGNDRRAEIGLVRDESGQITALLQFSGSGE